MSPFYQFLVMWGIVGLFIFIGIMSFYKPPECPVKRTVIYIGCGPVIFGIVILYHFMRIFVVKPIGWVLDNIFGLEKY